MVVTDITIHLEDADPLFALQAAGRFPFIKIDADDVEVDLWLRADLPEQWERIAGSLRGVASGLEKQAMLYRKRKGESNA